MSSNDFILEFEKPIRALEKQIESLMETSQSSKVDMRDEIEAMKAKLEQTRNDIYNNLTPWQRIQIARHPKRPTTLDYIQGIFTDFQELHGDRSFKDDAAMVGGPAFLNGEAVMVIGHQKGRDTKGNIKRNFGCPHPEGYRKALRIMKQAEKFQLPIITFVDTPGAYPGIGAEERHVSEAIAINIREMATLKVPIITVIIGEGGSGGALGIAVGNQISILENAYYSVISPEGCAAILWKDRANAPEAAEALKLSSEHLLKHGVVDFVVPEPKGGAHLDHAASIGSVKSRIEEDFKSLQGMDTEQLITNRYEKFRKMGEFVGE